MSYGDGTTFHSGLFDQQIPFTDGFCTAAPTELVPLQISNIAWATPLLTVGGQSLSVLQATCSTANTTAKAHCDLTDLILRTTAGKGATVTGLNVTYTFTTQPLTAVPTLAIVAQTFTAPQQAAAAPTASATLAGTITSTPTTPTLTVPTAGQYYTTGFAFQNSLALNNSAQRVMAELAFPLTNGTILQIAAVTVLFNSLPL